MPPIDHTPTSVIPRVPSDTGPLPALACRCRPCPSWRRVAAAALALAWVSLVLWAAFLALALYELAHAVLLLWAWR